MSQMTAAARTVSRPTPRPRRPAPERPTLRVVSADPRRRGQLPFVLLCSALLAAGLVVLLLLNTSLATGSYELQQLQERSAQLAGDEDALREQLTAKTSPMALAQSAAQLGMQPASSTGFVDVLTGEVTDITRPVQAEGEFRVVDDPAELTRDNVKDGSSKDGTLAAGSASRKTKTDATTTKAATKKSASTKAATKKSASTKTSSSPSTTPSISPSTSPSTDRSTDRPDIGSPQGR